MTSLRVLSVGLVLASMSSHVMRAAGGFVPSARMSRPISAVTAGSVSDPCRKRQLRPSTSAAV